MKNTLLILGGCLVALVGARATPITFQVSGTISEVVSGGYGLANAWGAVGDPFSGYFSYDADWHNAAGGSVSGASETYYYHPSGDPAQAAISLYLSTGSKSALIDGTLGVDLARVTHGIGGDTFLLGGALGSGVYGWIHLTDPSARALSSTDLPRNFNLADWSGNTEVVLQGFPNGGVVRMQISSLNPVPEAATTGALLGLAVLCLGAFLCWKGSHD